MRIFCIHCGAANVPNAAACVACHRVMLPAPLPTVPAGQPGQTRSATDLMAAPRAPAQPQKSEWNSRELQFFDDLPALAEDYTYGPQELAPYTAGFGYRFLALLVDLTTGGVALSLIFVLIGILQLALDLTNTATGALALIALFAWWPLYYIGFWAGSGRTLGYRVAGLQLVKSDGTRPTFGTSMVRFAGACCSMTPFFLGYLWMLWDTDRQTWHDKMAGTLVVRE